MIEIQPLTTIGVFGPVASGKTYLLKQWLQTQDRVIVFDATGEMLDVPNMERIFASPRQLFDRLRRSPYYFRIAYVPGPHLEQDFKWVIKGVWYIDSPKLLAIDEFHLICPVTAINEDVEMMTRFSRHAKLGVIGMSQRIADVSKLFTSACRMTILFHTQEARDLDAIRERWGSDTETMVEQLRPLIYDDVAGATSQVPQCVVCRKGSAPVIYDFATDSFFDAAEPEPVIEAEAEPEAEPEETAGTESDAE